MSIVTATGEGPGATRRRCPWSCAPQGGSNPAVGVGSRRPLHPRVARSCWRRGPRVPRPSGCAARARRTPRASTRHDGHVPDNLDDALTRDKRISRRLYKTPQPGVGAMSDDLWGTDRRRLIDRVRPRARAEGTIRDQTFSRGMRSRGGASRLAPCLFAASCEFRLCACANLSAKNEPRDD